jgi:bifunctional non-homologous end joining protein LigD
MTGKRFGRYTVELSKQDKVLFPDDGFTKGDLVAYYEAVADAMLWHLKDRPLSMKRFPDGIAHSGFFQKDASDYFPDWITRTRQRKAGGTVNYVVCDKVATLIYLANQGCIEYHVGLSRIDQIDHPDMLVVDLDPEEGSFALARKTALLIRDIYEEDLGLPAFAKTTGGNGVHVVTPLDRSASFAEVRSFARDLAVVIEREDPKHLTVESRKAKREGRMFLDVGRNGYGATAVCAYSVRARPGAHASMPIHWDEMEDAKLKPSRFTIKTVPTRLAEDGDAWAGMMRNRRSLKSAARKLAKL